MPLVGAGDAGALAALHERHSRAAYSPLKTTGGKRAAEGLVQNAFLKVWRSLGTYRAQRGSAKTWIITVDDPGIGRYPKRPRDGGARAGILAKGGSGNNREGAVRGSPDFRSVRMPRRVVAKSVAKSSQPNRLAGFRFRTKNSPTGGERSVALGRKIGHLAYKTYPCGIWSRHATLRQ